MKHAVEEVKIYHHGPAAMQSDGCVEPAQCNRCFAEDVGTTAAGAGGDGEIE
jgi:hypothetical protein